MKNKLLISLIFVFSLMSFSPGGTSVTAEYNSNCCHPEPSLKNKGAYFVTITPNMSSVTITLPKLKGTIVSCNSPFGFVWPSGGNTITFTPNHNVIALDFGNGFMSTDEIIVDSPYDGNEAPDTKYCLHFCFAGYENYHN